MEKKTRRRNIRKSKKTHRSKRKRTNRKTIVKTKKQRGGLLKPGWTKLMMLVNKHKYVTNEEELAEKLELDKNKTDLKTMSYYNRILYNKCTPIIKAIKIGNTNMVKLFLEEMDKTDINAVNDKHYGDTPLLCAIKENNLEMVKVLINNDKVDVNQKGKGEDKIIEPYHIPKQNIPLEQALWKGSGKNAEKIQLALLNHDEINPAIIGDGNKWTYWTALMIATRMCTLKIVNTLKASNKFNLDIYEQRKCYDYSDPENSILPNDSSSAKTEATRRYWKWFNKASQIIPKIKNLERPISKEDHTAFRQILDTEEDTEAKRVVKNNLKNAYEIFCLF